MALDDAVGVFKLRAHAGHYEYACAACGHQFEEWQKMTDKPVRTCPKCKAKKVEKLISQTSFSLKGGGWYSDLYAGPKPNGAKDTGSSKDSTDKRSEGRFELDHQIDQGDQKDGGCLAADPASNDPSVTKETEQ